MGNCGKCGANLCQACSQRSREAAKVRIAKLRQMARTKADTSLELAGQSYDTLRAGERDEAGSLVWQHTEQVVSTSDKSQDTLQEDLPTATHITGGLLKYQCNTISCWAVLSL